MKSPLIYTHNPNPRNVPGVTIIETEDEILVEVARKSRLIVNYMLKLFVSETKGYRAHVPVSELEL